VCDCCKFCQKLHVTAQHYSDGLMEKPESASGRQNRIESRDVRAKRPNQQWAAPSTPIKRRATANSATSQKKRKRSRKRLRYPQHEASSFSAAAFRGQVTQEVRGKNRITHEKQVTTRDFQSPLFSPGGGRAKIHRIRKRFRFIQTKNFEQIIVPFHPGNFAKSSTNYHKQISSTESFTSDANESAETATESGIKEYKSTKKKKSTKKRPPKITATTEFEFTDESINGSTAVMKDFNNFDISTEKPVTMGFNIEEEFTGKINFATKAGGGKKAITANDLVNFHQMEGVLNGLIVTKPSRSEEDMDSDLKDIIEANTNVTASKLKNPLGILFVPSTFQSPPN
jgi:hypothetical protein